MSSIRKKSCITPASMLLAIILGFVGVSQAADGAWIATGAMTTGGSSQTATLLPNGKVLIAAGMHSEILPARSCMIRFR
jgi:hypothetical protein